MKNKEQVLCIFYDENYTILGSNSSWEETWISEYSTGLGKMTLNDSTESYSGEQLGRFSVLGKGVSQMVGV